MAKDRTEYYAQYRKRPEALAAQRKHQEKWRKDHPDRYKKIKSKYRKDNGGLAIENKLATAKRRIERATLSDVYLRYMLKKHMEGVVKNIPPEMIEIYRKLLLTKRLLKIKKHDSNNFSELLSGHEKSTQRKLSRIINGQTQALNSKRGQ